NSACLAFEDCGHEQHRRNFQWLLRCRVRLGSGLSRCSGDPDLRDGIREEGDFHRPATDPAASRSRSASQGAAAVRKLALLTLPIFLVALAARPLPAKVPQAPAAQPELKIP